MSIVRTHILQKRRSSVTSGQTVTPSIQLDPCIRCISAAPDVPLANLAQSNGISMDTYRRCSLPVVPKFRSPLVRIQRRVSKCERPMWSPPPAKFDTTIRGDHLRRLIFLVAVLVIVTVLALSYSLYGVLNKVSAFRSSV